MALQKSSEQRALDFGNGPTKLAATCGDRIASFPVVLHKHGAHTSSVNSQQWREKFSADLIFPEQ